MRDLTSVGDFLRVPAFSTMCWAEQLLLPSSPLSVIGQSYAAEVANQHVMAGNAALLSCQLPSFVADLVRVVGWADDQGNEYLASGSANYGNCQFQDCQAQGAVTTIVYTIQ